jgi:hypothetical protein
MKMSYLGIRDEPNERGWAGRVAEACPVPFRLIVSSPLHRAGYRRRIQEASRSNPKDARLAGSFGHWGELAMKS